MGWLCIAVLPLLARAGEAPLQLAIGAPPGTQLLQLNHQSVVSRGPLPSDLSTPLGSLWKLFVYAYLVDSGKAEVGYTCKGLDRDEVYCCKAGERIERDQALTQSCGLYFSPANQHLNAADWRAYWQQRQAPLWLSDIDKLQPQQRVPVGELLQQLGSVPAQQQARRVLLDVMLHAPEGVTLGALGGRLRVKTWSWLADHDAQARQGGFAGWLVDGTPVWAGGSGTSQRILKDYAEALGSALPTPAPVEAGQCVEVQLFARYPVRQVRSQASGQLVAAGALYGDYEVQFANGNRLPISSAGELFVGADGQLTARLSREDYVARVLDREASAQPAEAAKALAITIRTYLLQSASRSGECLSIADSSASQRVAPRPASDGARQIAAWTSDLVLAGSPVTYHSDKTGPDRLAWQTAVAQAGQGLRYDAILARAFPRASLSRWDQPIAACQALGNAEDWLKKQQRSWREHLQSEPGYVETSDFAVCQLSGGKPHVDRERQRIYVRGMYSLQDRLDLTHEYLHLAFAAHPNGQDETYIEGLARHLLLE
ncbi:DUF2300 domain-containing protein [Pseudomonas sp. TE3786]